MENSPLHVCQFQPARGELMSALLDAAALSELGTVGVGPALCLVLSPEVVHRRSLIFKRFAKASRRSADLLGDECWKTGRIRPRARLEITATSILQKSNSLLLEPVLAFGY